MSVTDFFERGNPEDMDPELEQKSSDAAMNNGSSPVKNPKKERVYMLISIVVLAAVASLGFGIIEGLVEKSTGSGGLIISSVPLVHPSSDSLNSADLSNTAGGQAGGQNNAIPSGGEVVGNKATHLYELPWCQPQVSNIGQANQAWFADATAAQKAGYSADETCAGNE